MVSTPFLIRVGLGLAATAAEQTVAVPVRAWHAVTSLPTLPVRLAGDAVQAYMHAGQQVTELANRGDTVLAAVFPPRAEQPAWVTFDEDDEDPLVPARIYGLDDDLGDESPGDPADDLRAVDEDPGAYAPDTDPPTDDPEVATGRVRGRRG